MDLSTLEFLEEQQSEVKREAWSVKREAWRVKKMSQEESECQYVDCFICYSKPCEDALEALGSKGRIRMTFCAFYDQKEEAIRAVSPVVPSGWCIEHGYGVEDPALEWYEKAAENGLDHAQNNIGNIYNEEFYISSCKKILSKIKSLKITVDNYFTKLLRNNYARKKNTMNQIDFILSLQKEEFEPKFTEDQLKFIFDKMKNDKTGEIDRNDFKKAINREYNALNRIQDQIKKMKLTLDDISFRLEISCDDYYKDINFWEFKLKIKKR